LRELTPSTLAETFPVHLDFYHVRWPISELCPDGLEPTPEVLPFLMAVSRHLHMVNADPEAGAFKFHFLKSASLQPFVL